MAAALLTNLASLLKHRGCRHAAPISIGQPLRSARDLAASPWFAAGWPSASGLVANATQIVGGVIVFGDPLSTDPLGLALQATAFAMVCASALLIPAQGPPAKPLTAAI